MKHRPDLSCEFPIRSRNWFQSPFWPSLPRNWAIVDEVDDEVRGQVIDEGHVAISRSSFGQNALTSAAMAGLASAVLLSGGCGRQAAPDEATPPAVTAAGTPPLVPITNMVLVKAGSFIRQKHLVTLTHDFWLGKYEVTQGEYAAVMGVNPSHFKEGGTNCPVEKVSQIDAMRYCASLSQREREQRRLPAQYEYRLPWEAEWEYACRAGTTNLFSFGDSTTQASQYAWTSENSESKTHPVGLKRPNAWGLYDMHGNVWEWTLDWFAPYPAADLTDPTGPSEGKYKVFRGGGWNNEIAYARSANRFMMSPSNGIYFLGFRVTLGPKRQESSPPP